MKQKNSTEKSIARTVALQIKFAKKRSIIARTCILFDNLLFLFL